MMRTLCAHLTAIVAALSFCFVAPANVAADTGPPTDSHGLAETRALSKLPRELAKVLGWHGGDKDRIADLERQPAAAAPASFDRWFLLGGISSTYALIAIEERGSYRTYERIHANGYSLAGSDWVVTGEWILSSRPHTVDEMVQLIQSPESQALTARWQKWQRDRDLQRRKAESEPTRSYRPIAPFRENDINDEEVSQIEAVVRELIPGAIVMISGVAKGCPCEDGPGCSAQVWIAVHLPKQTRSLELSDINEHWAIGPVQQWFLDSAQLKRSNYATYADYAAAQETLDDRYPACTTEQSTAR